MENRSRKQFGPFEFDEGERMLWRDDQAVPLTPKASDLLAAFISQPGRLLSKDELLKTVWPDTYVEEANLAYHVFALRKALGDATGNGPYIETVPKRGYRFTADVSVVSGAADASEPEPRSLGTEAPRPSYEHPPTVHHPDPAFPFSRRLTIVALVLLAPLLYFGALSWRDVPTADPPRAVPLTSLPGVVRAPSLSPDGNYVVFTWTGEKEDNQDLYVHQVGAGGPHRVTTDPGNDFSPSWSPDGKTIAFLRRGARASHSELWLTAALGGSERKLVDVRPLLPSYRPHSIAWCHDSRCVLVTDSLGPDKPDALFAVSVESGEKRQLTDPVGLAGDGDPAVSPDGRSVVFLRYTTPFSGRLYRLRMADGMVPVGEPVPLTSWISAGNPAGCQTAARSCSRRVADSGSSTRSRVVRRRGFRSPAGLPVKVLDGVISGSFEVIDRGIYYVDQASAPSGGFFGEAPGADIRLQFYDFATGRSSTIASNLGPVFGVTASRDGRAVFFSRTDSSIDELMVVNDFR